MLANLIEQAGGPITMTPVSENSGIDKILDDPSGTDLISTDRRPARATRYRMSADFAASGEDFLVLTDAGEHVFRVDGKALDSDIIRIEELNGTLLYETSVHSVRKLGNLTIVDGTEAPAGRVRRMQVSPLRDMFAIELADGTLFSVDGAVSTHEYKILGPTGQVAEISRRWFRARGSYGVEIASGQPDAFFLTCIMAMDHMIKAIR